MATQKSILHTKLVSKTFWLQWPHWPGVHMTSELKIDLGSGLSVSTSTNEAKTGLSVSSLEWSAFISESSSFQYSISFRAMDASWQRKVNDRKMNMSSSNMRANDGRSVALIVHWFFSFVWVIFAACRKINHVQNWVWKFCSINFPLTRYQSRLSPSQKKEPFGSRGRSGDSRNVAYTP